MYLKTKLAGLLLLVLISSLPVTLVGQDVRIPGAINEIQFHQITTKTGLIYDVYVGLPAGYDENLEEGYPTLYATDASFGFLLVNQMQAMLQFGGDTPPIILVGIDKPTESMVQTLTQRYFELTPSVSSDVETEASMQFGMKVKTGGAGKLLAILEDDLIPWTEERFNTSQIRGLSGFSLGGLFTAYTLLEAPELFSHYLIGSPSLWWDNEFVFDLEAEFAENHDDLSARVFISVGGLEDIEMLPTMIRFAQILENRAYPNLRLTRHVFENESHMSVVPATFSRGFRYLFAEE